MPLILQGATSGQATIQATDAATVTLTLPATSGTLAVGGTTPSFSTLTVTGNTNLATTSGNVGIGTSSPATKLQIEGSGARVRLNDTSGGTADWGTDGTGTYWRDFTIGTFRWLLPSGEVALRIDSNGNLQLPKSGTKILNTSGNPILNQTGSILQVVQGTLSSSFSSSSSTFTAIGATLSITPSSANSRILLMASVGVGVSASNYVDMSIFRDSTNLAGSFGFITTYSSSATLNACQNFSHIDSPATTSAISYSIRMRTQTGVSYSVVGGTGQTCTLIAMEIAG